MGIFDENGFLSEEEREAYQRLLKIHGYQPHHFLLEVTEDQRSMDMNDLQYVIIVKTKAIDVKHHKSRTYLSPAGTGAWLAEFEEDLEKGYFMHSSSHE